MYPTLTIGSFSVSTFALTILVAIVVGVVLGGRQARANGLGMAMIIDLAFWSVIAGIIGSRLYALLSHPGVWQGFSLARLRETGMVWYGGAIAGVAVASWRYRSYGRPLSRLYDLGAPVLAAGHAIGRIGCLLAGDDYGYSTTLPWGIALPHGAPPSSAGYLRAQGDDIPLSIPDSQIMRVQPVMVYEAIGNALIAWFLWRRSHRANRPWSNVALYAMLYGVQRFLLEFLRPKDDRLSFGLTVAQLISVALVLVGVGLYYRSRQLAARPPAGEQR